MQLAALENRDGQDDEAEDLELFSEAHQESYIQEEEVDNRSEDTDENESDPMRAALRQSDIDGDGELSNEEFAAALKTMGMSASGDDFMRAMGKSLAKRLCLSLTPCA
jgi:hypothetical protein